METIKSLTACAIIMFATLQGSAATPSLITDKTQPSLSPRGDSLYPQFSGNDRYIVFLSDARNIVPIPGDDYFPLNIFRHDLLTHETVLVGTDTEHTGAANAPTLYPQISDDGQRILFNDGSAQYLSNEALTDAIRDSKDPSIHILN